MKSIERGRRTTIGLLIGCVLFVIAVIAVFSGDPVEATTEGVCEGTHIDGGNQTSITITAPEGFLISETCVKAGSIIQGDGPEITTYNPPVASVTITHSSDKEISHYTVTYVPVTTTSSSTTSSSTTTSSTTSSTTTSSTTTSTTGPPTPGLFSFGAAGTECQAEVPVILITFANTFPELAGDVGVLTVTALADDSIIGDVEVIYQPGTTVEFLYPGAEVDENGNIVDLPGWTLQDNGLWVIDESDAFLREGLLLTYTLGEEVATAEVTYPPESSTCANPPENPPVVPPVVPPVDEPPVIVPVPPIDVPPSGAVPVPGNPQFTG